jgi:hypothetical protein
MILKVFKQESRIRFFTPANSFVTLYREGFEYFLPLYNINGWLCYMRLQ